MIILLLEMFSSDRGHQEVIPVTTRFCSHFNQAPFLPQNHKSGHLTFLQGEMGHHPQDCCYQGRYSFGILITWPTFTHAVFSNFYVTRGSMDPSLQPEQLVLPRQRVSVSGMTLSYGLGGMLALWS